MVFLFLASLIALPILIVISVVAFMRKNAATGKKMLIFSGATLVVVVVTFLMVNNSGETENNENTSKPDNTVKTSAEPKVEKVKDWNEEITAIATSTDTTADKFNTLEKFMMDYRNSVKSEEITAFEYDIITDYKSGTYLNELENHERMLTNIFKSYIVEQNADGALKDFAFDYFQNLKYTYRGADTVDSEAVKANEAQMDKALQEIK